MYSVQCILYIDKQEEFFQIIQLYFEFHCISNPSKLHRQMRQSHQIEASKLAKFHELRQLQYFKNVLRKIEDLHIKEILPLYVQKIVDKTFDHKNYVYIPDKPIDDCPAGSMIAQCVSQLSKRVTLYRITRKMDKILRRVIPQNIPVINKIKIQDRFAILNSCKIQNYAFNRHICRRGCDFEGIFFLLEGELKIVREKTSTPLKIITKNSFIGIYEMQNDLNCYINTIVSNSNSTQILMLDISILNAGREISNTSLKMMFLDHFSQANIVESYSYRQSAKKRKLSQHKAESSPENKCQAKNKENNENQNKQNLKFNYFVSKYENFLKKTSINDKGFNDYIKSKKILLQLKEIMTVTKNNGLRQNKHDRRSLMNELSQINFKCKLKPSLNTNLSTCRSQLFKENILRRLQIEKNYNRDQQNKKLEEELKYSLGMSLVIGQIQGCENNRNSRRVSCNWMDKNEQTDHNPKQNLGYSNNSCTSMLYLHKSLEKKNKTGFKVSRFNKQKNPKLTASINNMKFESNELYSTVM